MRNRVGLWAGTVVLSIAGFGFGIAAEDAGELSRQATDPTASLMAFNFINDFRTSYYDVDDNGYEFRFQPVIPFRAWGTSNILRIGMPFQIDGPGDEGLKSVTLFDLVVLQHPREDNHDIVEEARDINDLFSRQPM